MRLNPQIILKVGDMIPGLLHCNEKERRCNDKTHLFNEYFFTSMICKLGIFFFQTWETATKEEIFWRKLNS